jgi:hypothetical protein
MTPWDYTNPLAQSLSFSLALVNSITPIYAAGSGTAAFTRADGADGIATVTDFEGRVIPVKAGEARFMGGYRIRNLSGPTETVGGTGWTVSNASITTGVSDPIGGSSAITLTATSNVGEVFQTSAASIPIGNSITQSFWIRRRAGSGTVQYNKNAVRTTIPALSSTWQRISPDTYAATTGTHYIDITLQTSGDAVDFWRPQLEDVTGATNTAPGPYVSVGVLSAPYNQTLTANGVAYDTSATGVDGVAYSRFLPANTVTNNTVTEAVGAAISSSQASCAGGVTAGVVDANGPVGYLSEGSRVQYLGVTDTPATQTTASLGTGTYTLWVVGAGTATSSAGTATITGGGAASAGTPNVFTVTVAGTVTVTVSGALTRFQLEKGAFASTYIPNAGAAGTSVTRAAALLRYPLTGNISNTVGTASAEVANTVAATGWPLNPTITDAAILGDQSGNGIPLMGRGLAGSAKLTAYDGTTYRDISAAGFVPSTTVSKVASSWSGSTLKGYVNGVAASATFDGDMSMATAIEIGSYAGIQPWFGTIRNVKIWTRQLSDGQIAAI